MPTSRSYHEFLMETLANREETAAYIEVTLTEGADEPKLLPKVLRNVVEAYVKMNNLAESTKLKHEYLDGILTASGCAEIYAFVELLDAFGFRLAVTCKEDESIAEEATKE
ncbi:transcriptional regulator [Oscillatoriales cyanobacterium USR001]|nr:transcriptional regulator [Oscillatoriales cyanobacterium USR001]